MHDVCHYQWSRYRTDHSLSLVEAVKLLLVNFAVATGVSLFHVGLHITVQFLGSEVLISLGGEVPDHLLHFETFEHSVLVGVVLVEKGVDDLPELLLVHAESFVGVVAQLA